MNNDYLNFDWTQVIEFESGGEAYYNKFLKKMTWPGGASGITGGIGFDFGYMSRNEFDKYFANKFSEPDANRLRSILGIKGSSAKANLSKVKDISLDWDESIEIFQEWVLPKFWNLTNNIWPGVDDLCEKAAVGLTSIVFNRGSSLKGDSRREMAAIRPLVKAKDYKGISAQIKSMKRLWRGKGLDGLLKRRDKEAEMVLSCLN